MTATSPTCLVLGGKGFVGSAVAAEAARRGYRALVVDKDEYAATIGTSCDLLINANGNSRKYLAAKDPAQEFDLSVRSVQRSLHDFKTGHYVHLSTIDVYPDHEDPAKNAEDAPIDEKALSPYGFHKHLAERLVRYYAPRWTVVRMGGFVGPGLWKNSIHDLLTGRELKVHPDSVYQYLHTAVLAQRLFDIVGANRPGEIWNVCGSGTVSLRDVASWIPGATWPANAEELPREHYEISTRKTESLFSLPRSADAVRRFVQEVHSGKERIQ